jgi:YesN/AraC family two-component response regulator
VINFLPEFLQSSSTLKLLEMFSAAAPGEHRHLRLCETKHAAIYALLERMHEEYTARKPEFEQVLRIYLNRLLLEVYHLYSSGATERHLISLSSANTKIKAVIQYLSQHYAEDISLNDLAKMFYLDPYYLCHLFKRTTGDTIRQYVLVTRIHHAKTYLILTDWPISEIAKKVGFSNFSYFGLIFKRLEGMVPRAFRKKWSRSNQDA